MLRLLVLIPFIANVILLSGCADLVNRVQLGEANLTVKIHTHSNSDKWPDSINVSVTRPAFLEGNEANRDFINLQFDGETWKGTIPMYLLYTNRVALIIENQDENFFKSFFLGLNQTSPSTVDIFQLKNGTDSISVSGGTGWCNVNKNGGFTDIEPRFHGLHIIVPAYNYMDWENYITCETDSIFPRRLKYSFENYTLTPEEKTWITAGFKIAYFTGRVISYSTDASEFYNLDIDAPPAEMYAKFLKGMDFSSSMLDCFSADYLYSFLTTFFNRMPLGINPIGDTRITEWQKETKEKVKKVVPKPTPTIMNLLTATSYLMQIEQNHPLTATQKKNIAEFYIKDDLGKLILRRNNAIAIEKNTASLIDLTAEEDNFDIEALTKQYSNRPIVIEFWNTWCSPCRKGMKEIQEFLMKEPFPDVVFIYIADETSPLNIWKTMAERHNGTHFRISTSAANAIKEKYNIQGVPYYMFYDADHRLVHSLLGFSGIENYRHMLFDISNQNN